VPRQTRFGGHTALPVQYVALMDAPVAALATAIGDRVKQERNARRWTLDRLADSAGVSRRMLVSVEQGAVNPSVGTLLRIGDALGVGLPALVAFTRSRPVKVTRRGHGAVLWSGESGGRGVLVAGTDPPDVLELWDWALQPGEEHISETHAAGTKEVIQVQHGRLTITVGEESVILQVGDAASFPGDVRHAYANSSTRIARFGLAVFEPGVGAGPHAEVADA
jgi:transcriptional regulator with XRE-family HTH domain